MWTRRIQGRSLDAMIDLVVRHEFGHALNLHGYGVGYLVDHYGPTPPFPNGPRFADYALREAVLGLRQAGQRYEALEARDWCEIQNASCVNHRTNWSAETSQFEQYMTERLALPRVATP